MQADMESVTPIGLVRQELENIIDLLTDDKLAEVEASVLPFVQQTRKCAVIALAMLDRSERVKDTCVTVAQGWKDPHGVGAAIAQYIEEKV